MAWPQDLQPYSSLQACRRYWEVEDLVWEAFIRAIGDPGDNSALLANLPPSTVAQAVESAELEDGTKVTVIQATQLGLVYRLARRKLHLDNGLDLNLWVDPDPWQESSASFPPSPPTSQSHPQPDRKMKFSAVLDQSDETEFAVATEQQKQLWLQNYVSLTGGLPQENEEPSTEQISAMRRRILQGMSPYADFALFVPYGKKAMRAHKYRTYLPAPGGGYMMREVPGPSNFTQWQASFRVYRTTLLMLDVVTMATLVSYEALIEKLTRLYPGAWHLIVAADDLGRSEHLNRLKVTTLMEIADGGKVPQRWDEKAPWEALFKLLLKDHHFWSEQVHVPANAWLSHGAKGVPSTPAEALAESTMYGGADALKPEVEGSKKDPTPGSSPSARRSKNKIRRELKKKRDAADREELRTWRAKGQTKGKGKGKQGSQLCFAWNNNNGACAGLPPGSKCQGRVPREHKCTTCGSPGHPAHQCPQKEGQ